MARRVHAVVQQLVMSKVLAV
eukprot:COSAG06_NODE_56418_length_284_cov_9.329730_1_plen_20_part_10